MLKKIINKIFGKKKIDRTTAIANVLELIDIPPREYIENEKVLNQIDEYKKEYLKVINSKRHLVHTDFNNSPLKEELKMNVDLILNLLYENPIKIYKEKNIDYINILKLKIYKIVFQNLEIETIARIVALNEIKEEKKTFMSKRKIESITNEIESLTRMIMIFASQKRAILTEEKVYLDSKIEEYVYEDILLKRLERVEDLASVVIPDKLRILKQEEDLYQRIALIESELEIYAYKSKDRLDKINILLDNLFDSEYLWAKKNFNFYRNWIYKDLNFIDGLDILEKEVLVFALYGRRLISEERLKGLYEVKFNALTENINIDRTSPVNEKTNNFELECYKNIVMKKIEEVITKKVKVFETNTKLDNMFRIRDVIKLFKEIVSSEGIYDTEKILNEPIILAFILAFDSLFRLNKYFDEFKVPKSAYDINYYEDVFKLEDELPLSTIYWLFHFTEYYREYYYRVHSQYKVPYSVALGIFYNKYIGFDRLNDYSSAFGVSYNLPEGIVEIVEPSSVTLGEESMLDIFKREIKGKIVIMPKSLKLELCPFIRSLASEIKYSTSYNSECLLKKKIYEFERRIRKNNGDLWVFFTETLLIPSIADAKILANLKIDFMRLATMCFYDFENSKILNEKMNLNYFVEILIEAFKTGWTLSRIVFLDNNMEEILQLNMGKIFGDIVSRKYEKPFEENEEFYLNYIIEKIINAKVEAKQKLEEDRILKLIKNK